MRNILISFSLLFLFTACDTGEPGTVLGIEQFESAIGTSGGQVLDVRTPKEFQSGHLKGALLADWKNQAEFQYRADHLDKTKPVLIYCAAGSRSAAAAKSLRARGFTVQELKGGFEGWKGAGKEVEQVANEQPITLAEYKVLTNLAPVVLVDIGADWCPPCRKMDPVIGRLQGELPGQFKLVKIDAGAQADLMKLVGASKIPTFIIYQNGTESWRKEGIVSAEELKLNLR